MAGEKEDFEINSQINKWFLDYICSITWKDFTESRQVTSGERDLIQGMFYMMQDESECKEQKLFLVLLCRMSDGEDCDTRYSEDSNITVLEDMLARFESFIKMQTKELMAEGKELISVIKAEAVMVCCRANEFDLAQEVCDRLWPKKDRKDKVYESMRALLRQGNTDNVFLKDYSYNDFLSSMLKYLSKIQQHFTTPLVVEAARKLLKHKNSKEGTIGVEMNGEVGNQNNSASAKQTFSNKVLQRSAEKKGRELHSPNRRMRKLWNNNTDNLFGTPSSPDLPNQTPQDKPNPTPLDKQNVKEKEDKQTSKKVSPDSQTLTEEPKSKSNRTPSKRQKTPDDDVFQAPAPPAPSPSRAKYRKNINREDRHKPLATSSESDLSDDDDDISVGTTEGVYVGQRRVKWTEEEMEDFYDAVKAIGVGNWAGIRDYLGTLRTGVQLKDKWRTMQRRGDIEKIVQKRQKSRAKKT